MRAPVHLILLVGLLGGCQHNQPGQSTSPESTPQRVVTLDGGVVVDLDARSVRVPGWIAIDQGWLEVVACMQGTREHEAIVVTAVTPGIVHAGLLLIGLEPGRPAKYDSQRQASIPPQGAGVGITLEWAREDGRIVRTPIADLLHSERDLPRPDFVFAGSIIAPNSPSMGPGEHYVADFTGNIVGLATFGDEVIAARQVHSPELGVEAEAWRIRNGALPRSGTPLWLEITPLD